MADIFYGDALVRQDQHGFISLNDMWLAAGKPEGKLDPRRWAGKPYEKISGSSGKPSVSGGPGYEFIEFIANKLNVNAAHIYKTTRGKYGGTWAHWQIALAYAKYLSPEFHAWANQVIKERIEENASPELGIARSRDRAVAAWRKQGKDEAFISARLKGIDARNVFTETLGKHGISGSGFGICTNNIYKPVVGGTAAEVRKQKGLPDKCNLRDHMSAVELAGTFFAETLASDKIQRENRQGLNPCASACLSAGMDVKAMLDKHEHGIAKAAPKDNALPTPTPLGARMDRLREAVQAK